MRQYILASLLAIAGFCQVQAQTTVTSYSFVNEGGLKYELKKVTTLAQPAVGYVTIASTNDSSGLAEIDTIVVGKPAVPESSTVTRTGRIVGVEVKVTPDSNIAIPHVRKVELLSMTEEVDMEMILQTKVNFYDLDGETPLSEVIGKDSLLTPDAKSQKLRLIQSYTLSPKRTRDSWVNPMTGSIVEESYPGAIREAHFMQRLTKPVLLLMGLNVAGIDQPEVLRLHMLAYMIQAIVLRDKI